MGRPRLLDLFCGAGGAAMGYYQAGFDVVGVDIAPQKRYPFEFHQADALTYPLNGFDVIHASPPCQDYTVANNWRYPGKPRKEHPRLIVPMLNRLHAWGGVWVLENVRMALDEMENPLRLCGTSLGLRVQRHRLFDSNVVIFGAGPCKHRAGDISVRTHRCEYLGMYTPHTLRDGRVVDRKPYAPVGAAREAMGIDWMVGPELGEAIPPAYTEWIGRQLLAALALDEAV